MRFTVAKYRRSSGLLGMARDEENGETKRPFECQRIEGTRGEESRAKQREHTHKRTHSQKSERGDVSLTMTGPKLKRPSLAQIEGVVVFLSQRLSACLPACLSAPNTTTPAERRRVIVRICASRGKEEQQRNEYSSTVRCRLDAFRLLHDPTRPDLTAGLRRKKEEPPPPSLSLSFSQR